MSGAMTDKKGNKPIGSDEYRPFTHRLVLVYALILGAVVLVGGLLFIGAAYFLITSILDGTLLEQVPNLPVFELYSPGIPE